MKPAPSLTGVDFSVIVDFVKKHKKIRWVFSDIDGTLIGPEAIVDLYVKAARTLGIDISCANVLPWLGKIPIQDPVVAARTIFSQTVASLDNIAAVIRQYESEFRRTPGEYFQHYVYPDVPSSLARLQELGVGLSIISNRYEELAFRQIIGTDIANFVSHHTRYVRTEGLAVCGGDTPSLEAGDWRDGKIGELEVHLHHLPISPNEAVVVGDQPDSDIAAAYALEMPGILIVRDSE